MAGQVLKRRRLVNPGRRRKMTPKQIRYFGTKRQKNALKNRRHNAGRRTVRGEKKAMKRAGYSSRAVRGVIRGYRGLKHRKRRNQGIVSQAESAATRAIRSVEDAAQDAIGAVTREVNSGRRRKNVGEILTVIPANPGRRRKPMATKRKRRRARVSNRSYHRRANRRRANVHHRRRSNPKVVVRYRNRRHNRTHRRRNQGAAAGMRGDVATVVGILGGAAVTKVITGFLPANFQTGWGGAIATGLVAVVTGQVAGRVLGNRKLGNWVTVGGLLIVGLQIAQQFGLNLPFGLTTGTTSSGTGMITSSNFFVPQVNLPGSMASFVPPAAIPAPVVVPATAMRGLGTGTSAINQGLRRVGRLR